MRSTDYPASIPANIKRDKDGNADKIKFFWAFVVWNFDAYQVIEDGKTKSVGDVQILELTQSTIISQVQELINSEEWGDPRGYSLTVSKKGDGLQTEYSVVPSPAQETPADILKAYEDKAIKLELLFEGGNPFQAE